MAQAEIRSVEAPGDPALVDAKVLRMRRSALLHPRAADALVLAGAPYPGETPRRRRPGGGPFARVARWFLAG
jgi:hypothetical protein